MKNLISLLQETTDDLKVEYLVKCEEYAITEFDRKHLMLANMPKRYSQEWFNHFSIASKQSGNTIQKWIEPQFRNKQYYDAVKQHDNLLSFVGKGKAAFIAKVNKDAITHYENSTIKLATRIIKKGLNIETMTIKKARIGINLEINLTDGIQTVRAWTIIAKGVIVRPHYRYLVR